MDWYSLSDSEIINRLGTRIKQLRLRKNIPQKGFADKSGIDRTTLSKFENGSPISLLTFIQILRAMEVLENLEELIPMAKISPLQMVELKGKERQRASGKSVPDKNSDSSL